MAVQLAAPLSAVFTPAMAAGTTAGNALNSGVAGPARSDARQGGDAAPMARAAAAGEAGQAGQQWLSQFGTARVQLNLDNNFILDGSAVDVLVPLRDTPESTLFTQLGARSKDNRNTVNIGAGVRTQQGNWLYGANTFYDYDLTGNHHRLGVGAEAWADYLKLSANGYYGLSDWRQSRDFADYKERPANGFDLRAEAWLPSQPQWGGKLMYEHYLGENVALFGKNNRQKDPYALTASVNYTPIPLLTVGGQHRTGKGGASDSGMQFQLNYRLGESWQSHLDPSKVAASRTLAGSRLDLVERNNHIVLDYQKQESIRLSLPARLAGFGGETVTLRAQVTASNVMDQLKWDAAALVAAGGTITQTSPQSLAITLPAHQGEDGNNLYTVSAVAYDVRGNASNRAETTLQVNPSVIAPVEEAPVEEPPVEEPETPILTITQLVVLDNGAPADGQSVIRAQAQVQDSHGEPIAGAEVSFSADNGAVLLGTLVKTDEQGIAQTGLTQTTAGITTVTARLGESRQQAQAEFIPEPVAQVLATVVVMSQGTRVANGEQSHDARITLKSLDNEPLADYLVGFNSPTGIKIESRSEKTDANGVLDVFVTSTRAGDLTFTAKGEGFETQSDAMTFVAGALSPSASSISILTNGTYPNNGSLAHRVQVMLTDDFGNPIAEHPVSFAFTTNYELAELKPESTHTGQDGKIFASVRSFKTQWISVEADAGSFQMNSPSMPFASMIES